MVENQKIAAWLSGHDNVVTESIVPVNVKIGKVTYPGAAYIHKITRQERIYLVGDLPAAYIRSSRLAFQFEGDDRDWYVASHAAIGVENDPHYARYHPFGQDFSLSPWVVRDGRKIDDFIAPRRYRRMKAVLMKGEAANG